MTFDKNQYIKNISTPKGERKIFSLNKLKEQFPHIAKLPFSIRILLEQALRNYDDFNVTGKDIENLANWDGKNIPKKEIAFKPTRVILQDFTGVPALVDLASLRSKMKSIGKDPQKINPLVPVDLVIDHSIQVDYFGADDSLKKNSEEEFRRNKERYEFIKWGQNAFKNFTVFPPGAGIIHQVNLEHIAKVTHDRDGVLFPDTVVGTDSHTTMINGIGVMGWGVGGIEAESVMLGQPIFMKIPEVIGFRFKGQLNPGVTATDLVLRVTEMLRKKGVVEKFVEFCGSGLSGLSLADRATIANMAPEYGATMGFFPVDEEALRYMTGTGRDADLVNTIRDYCKEQSIFRTDATEEPIFTDLLELDLSEVQPALAGPKRPQDRINLKELSKTWETALQAPIAERGYALEKEDLNKTSPVEGMGEELTHGSVVIAAITSCTNTSNPSVMLGAGIVAKKAAKLGLKSKPWVKTSLAPGSRAVTDYLEKTGLDKELEKMGFFTVGYGCTTCIGNSGPLDPKISQAIRSKNLIAASVLSGNRNFEGRVHADVKANFLASPPLVVAYAIAGNVSIDLEKSPIGTGSDGQEVYLKDIWPTAREIDEARAQITPDIYLKRYASTEGISQEWTNVETQTGNEYVWDQSSTYIQNPPFFTELTEDLPSINPIEGARVLLKLGDSITTDHISPAGAFTEETPAGKFLCENKVSKADFNSYGSRRGNDRIMTRGTFANIRIRNQLVPGVEGGFTKHFASGETMTIYDAALKYREQKTPLVVLAGSEYGTGSSRDWAAKGTYLLGVKAVIASGYERIHRSNLIGMGVLPLQFLSGETHQSLGLTGEESFTIEGLDNNIAPSSKLTVKADDKTFQVLCRLDTPVEIKYYRNGGILHTVLRDFLSAA